jgi:D-3-phosphoglycerate dehydrogenase
MTYHILITDPLEEDGVKILRETSEFVVELAPKLSPSELKEKMKQADALIVRSGTRVTGDLLEGNTRLKLIARAGIGVDNVDVRTATEKGIVVMNTPGGNATTTAEHTIALLFSLARWIPQAYTKLREGVWDRKSFMGIELSGKTLGIVGLGNVGSLVAQIALGIPMKVLGYDPYLNPDRLKGLEIEIVEDLRELLKRADVVSLHVPLNEKTRGLIGVQELKLMKPTALLINCARGGIVDEDALFQALKEERIAGAALDVFAEEPPPPDHPLLKSSRAIFTPHLGASTYEAQIKVAIEVAEQVRDFFLKGEIRNAVNAPRITRELLLGMKPYLEFGELLGRMATQLHSGRIDTIELHFQGEMANLDPTLLSARMLKGILECIVDYPVNEINAQGVAGSRGIRVQTVRSTVSEGYTSSLGVVLKDFKEVTEVHGALLERAQPRIIRIGPFRVEFAPGKGTLVIFRNRDVPGVIGKVGTIFGAEKINIAQMYVGRAPEEAGMALTIVLVDDPVPLSVIEELTRLPEILQVRQIQL